MPSYTARVDAIAKELRDHVVRVKDSWATAGKSSQAFYRKIARWHLSKLEQHGREA